MTATERHPTSLQCWPSGKSLYYSGDPHGTDLRTHTGYSDKEGTPASAEDAKTIRIQIRAAKHIDDEILCCDSALVDELLQASFEPLASAFSWSEVENLRPDPSEWDLAQCREWLEDNGHDLPDPNPWAMGRPALVEFLMENGTGNPNEDCPNDTDTPGLLALAIDRHFDDGSNNLDDWREAVRDNAEDATVYQWFRVTNWFCKQLRAAGEVVLDNNYGCWYGRQCCGQSIIMDGIMQKVAATQEE